MSLVSDFRNRTQPTIDEGGIIGHVELLKKAWDLIKTRGPELGLHLTLPRASGPGSILSADPCPIGWMESPKRTFKLSPTPRWGVTLRSSLRRSHWGAFWSR